MKWDQEMKYKIRRGVATICLTVGLGLSLIPAIHNVFASTNDDATMHPIPTGDFEVIYPGETLTLQKEVLEIQQQRNVLETEPKVQQESKKQKVQQEPKEKEESSIYNEAIPMPKEHQEYLAKLCEERGLDYEKTLAVLKHESQFDPNATNETHDYGYFQINIINHKDLSELLHTPNKPLDPYINMNWGTQKLANLYAYWEEHGVKGKQLDESVWSSYNRGIRGFNEHGPAVDYIKQVRTELVAVDQMLHEPKES